MGLAMARQETMRNGRRGGAPYFQIIAGRPASDGWFDRPFGKERTGFQSLQTILKKRDARALTADCPGGTGGGG